MKQVTATGHNVEEAVESALSELKTTKDKVEISIVDEGKKGILGIFGSRPAIVKVKIKNDPIEEAIQFLKNVCLQMEVEVQVNSRTDGKHVYFELSSEKAGFLIGKRGQTLNALQSLTQLVLNRFSDQFFLLHMDIENYRERREESLVILANRLANKAIRENKQVSLEPMPSYERRVIHTALAENDKITTYSVGTDPNRHLVIAPKKQVKI